jgi:hypothetical protein
MDKYVGILIGALAGIACAEGFSYEAHAQGQDAGADACVVHTARFPASAFTGVGGIVYDTEEQIWTGINGAVLVAPLMPAIPEKALVHLLAYSFAGEGFYSVAIKSINGANGKVAVEVEAESRSVGQSQARETLRAPMRLSNTLLYTIEAKITDKKGGVRGGWIKMRICYPVVL